MFEKDVSLSKEKSEIDWMTRYMLWVENRTRHLKKYITQAGSLVMRMSAMTLMSQPARSHV